MNKWFKLPSQLSFLKKKSKNVKEGNAQYINIRSPTLTEEKINQRHFVFRVTKEMVECVNRVAYNEKGSGCSEAQVERLLQYFGPIMQRDMALSYNPANCKSLKN